MDKSMQLIKSPIYDGREIIVIRKFTQNGGQHVSKS